MYRFYKIISVFAKFFSNLTLVFCVPISLLLCGLGWCMFFIKEIGTEIAGNSGWCELSADGSNSATIDALNVVRWVGLAIAIFIILIYVLLLTAWILKMILYKKIADNYITRNKEWRNRDINKVIEKLETYRYRD